MGELDQNIPIFLHLRRQEQNQAQEKTYCVLPVIAKHRKDTTNLYWQEADEWLFGATNRPWEFSVWWKCLFGLWFVTRYKCVKIDQTKCFRLVLSTVCKLILNRVVCVYVCVFSLRMPGTMWGESPSGPSEQLESKARDLEGWPQRGWVWRHPSSCVSCVTLAESLSSDPHSTDSLK